MRKLDEKGQITVYLSLTLLVFFSLAFCVLAGVHGYMESALAGEAAVDAGNEILANYDKYLFEKYHVFFLDPREKECIEEDAKQFLDTCVSSGFYDIHCQEVSLSEEKSAVDEKGLFLRHQINEYMKHRQAALAGEGVRRLIESSKRKLTDIPEEDFDKDEGKEEHSSHSASAESRDGGGDSSRGKDEGSDENEKDSARREAAKNSWTDLKKQMSQILHAGVLLYAADYPEALSAAAIRPEGLPSASAGGGRLFGGGLRGGFSWSSLGEWKSYLHSGALSEMGDCDPTMDPVLLPYLFECYSCYGKEDAGKEGVKGETVLRYELEYLVAGRTSDIENLKAVADRILLMRFLVNYSYASRDPSIQAEAEAMAGLLTSIAELPAAAEAVKVLLTAALSYGESLLELHALMNGEKVALVKNSSNWNLRFSDAPGMLSSKASIKSVDNGAGYRDYLTFFLLIRSSQKDFLYRMMDIMQVNTRLREPDFTMKESLFSFSWNLKVECRERFVGFSGSGRGKGGSFLLDMNRYVSYW